MSAQFTSLHPYVSQRLLSLFETLAKKHVRLEARIRAQPTVSSDSTIVTVNGTVANTDLVRLFENLCYKRYASSS